MYYLYQIGSVKWGLVSLAVIGTLFITSAIVIGDLWTAEITPTVVRTAGIGVASMFGRIGTLLAPTIGKFVSQSC